MDDKTKKSEGIIETGHSDKSINPFDAEFEGGPNEKLLDKAMVSGFDCLITKRRHHKYQITKA